MQSQLALSQVLHIMSSEVSITQHIENLIEKGDERAAFEIFNRYFDQLRRVAAGKLGGAPRGCEDEEDVVMSAMESFFRRAAHQEFPRLRDSASLWQLLLKITERKAINQRKRQMAKKRGAGRVLQDSGEATVCRTAGLAPATPDSYAMFREQYQLLMESLPHCSLRTVATMKLDGYSNAEIAERLDVVVRTVERKLNLIRDQWSELCP